MRPVRGVQPSGSLRSILGSTLRIATLAACAVTGCARANGERAPDASESDARPIDAASVIAPDVAIDGAIDTALPDAPGCAISAGVAPAIDGVDDLNDYPVAQRVTPGAMLGADGVAITWDAAHLYVTVGSMAFESDYEPVHIYVESGTALAPAAPALGKEYSGLVPMLPFTPTHLIAARRTNGPSAYDAVYLPDATWTTRGTALDPGTAVFVAADHHALSVAVPWAALGGCPTMLRLAVHVVHGVSANEWKDLVPTTHTPWLAPGGGYYEVDLTGSTSVASWTLR
jgi:hypothetical protein